ncbi:hypothetical protein BC828DRAFT_393915, partial [Blastocladiella britannica]
GSRLEPRRSPIQKSTGSVAEVNRQSSTVRDSGAVFLSRLDALDTETASKKSCEGAASLEYPWFTSKLRSLTNATHTSGESISLLLSAQGWLALEPDAAVAALNQVLDDSQCATSQETVPTAPERGWVARISEKLQPDHSGDRGWPIPAGSIPLLLSVLATVPELPPHPVASSHHVSALATHLKSQPLPLLPVQSQDTLRAAAWRLLQPVLGRIRLLDAQCTHQGLPRLLVLARLLSTPTEHATLLCAVLATAPTVHRRVAAHVLQLAANLVRHQGLSAAAVANCLVLPMMATKSAKRMLLVAKLAMWMVNAAVDTESLNINCSKRNDNAVHITASAVMSDHETTKDSIPHDHGYFMDRAVVDNASDDIHEPVPLGHAASLERTHPLVDLSNTGLDEDGGDLDACSDNQRRQQYVSLGDNLGSISLGAGAAQTKVSLASAESRRVAALYGTVARPNPNSGDATVQDRFDFRRQTMPTNLGSGGDVTKGSAPSLGSGGSSVRWS